MKQIRRGFTAALAVLALLMTGFVFPTAARAESDPNATPSFVTVKPEVQSVTVGSSVQFTATAYYADGTSKDVTAAATWTSGNLQVATISGGLARGVAAGTVTIRAMYLSVTGTATLNVNAPPPPSVTSVTVVADQTLPKGRTAQLVAWANYSDGTSVDVTNSAQWSSSNPAVATVSSTGLVTAQSASGTAAITAAYDRWRGSATITAAPPVVDSITITGAIGPIPKGKSVKLTAIARYSDGTTRDVSCEVTWTSSNPAVASIDSCGTITAHASSGTVIISVSYGGPTASIVVTVCPPVKTGLVLSPASATVPQGEIQGFTAKYRYSDGTTDPNNITDPITWSSSNPAVAVIAGTGVATAKSEGSTTITGTAGGVSGTATLTVVAAIPKSIAFSPESATIPMGSTLTIRVLATMTDGTLKDVSKDCAWNWGNPAVVTQAGLYAVKGVGEGSTSIGCTIDPGLGKAPINKTMPITVGPPILTGLTVAPKAVTLPVWQSAQLEATGKLQDGSPLDVKAAADWQSSDPEVACVEQGKVTGLKDGTVTITATYAGKSDTATVTVTPVLVNITVTPETVQMAVNSTRQLTATGRYTNDHSDDVTNQAAWFTDDASVATVSAAGLVTAVGKGTTTITASKDGVLGSAVVVVWQPGLTIAPANFGLPKGTSLQVKAMLANPDGSMSDVTAQAAWATSNPAVVTVSGGLVTAVAGSGSAEISAAYQGFTATTTVETTGPILASATVTPDAVALRIGQTAQLNASADYSDGSKSDVTNLAAWSSSNLSVATVSNTGVVTAKAAGQATITATYGNKSDSTVVTVTPPPTLVSLQIRPPAPALAPGAGLQLVATATYSDGSAADVTTQAAWSSSNPLVATVSATGYVTAVAAGTAQIQATYGGLTGSDPVTVTACARGSSFDCPLTLQAGIAETGTVAAQQSIYYAVALTVGPTVTVTLTGTGNPDLYVYGPGHNLIGQSTRGAGLTDEVTFAAASSGTYYVRVYGAAAGSYRVVVLQPTTPPRDPGIPIDPPPPNPDM